MKPRLPASISALMAGECARICKAISGLLPESQIFNGFGRSCTSFQFQRFKSSKGLIFKVHNDDNDFSDLGPPVERGFGQLKLLTEKRDPFLKLDNGRKVASRKSRSESLQRVKGKILTLNEPQLVEAVSVFGKLCGASVRHLPGLLNCWDIQFESLESCDRAVRAGVLTVGSSRFPIHPLRTSMVVTIRIEDISKDASFHEIHAICKQVGMIEGLTWVCKDSVDALFAVENDTELELILKKLNGTIVGGHCLSASLLHGNSSSASMSENEDTRCKTALQISNYLTELKMQLKEKKMEGEEFHVLKVLIEDLQMLHEGIMHLEDLSSIIDTSDK